MPEIILYYLAQPRSLYIQVTTTVSEALYSVFDKEELFRDNIKCFSIIAACGRDPKSCQFILLQPHEHLIKHYEKGSTFIIALTEPPHMSEYQSYLRETEDFLHALYLNVRLSLKLGLLSLGSGVIAQLIAQSILIDYGLNRSAPFRQDASRIMDIMYDYLPDAYFYNLLGVGPKGRTRRVKQCERAFLTDIFRYLQLQHLTRSTTRIYIINYLVMVKKGTVHRDSLHFYGVCLKKSDARKGIPCKISVSNEEKELCITVLRPTGLSIHRRRLNGCTIYESVQIRQQMHDYCVKNVLKSIKRNMYTDTVHKTATNSIDRPVLDSYNPALYVFYLAPYIFYRNGKVHTINYSNCKGAIVMDTNLLVLSIGTGDSVRDIFIRTPGAAAIVGLLALFRSNVKGLNMSIKSSIIVQGYSISEESPIVSVINAPSPTLRTQKTIDLRPELQHVRLDTKVL